MEGEHNGGWAGPTVVGGLEAANGPYVNGFKTYTDSTGPIGASYDGVKRYWVWQDSTEPVSGFTTVTMTKTVTGLVSGANYRIGFSIQAQAGGPYGTGAVRRRLYLGLGIGTATYRARTDAQLEGGSVPTGYASAEVLTLPSQTAADPAPRFARTLDFTATAASMTLTLTFTQPGNAITNDANDDVGVGAFTIACL